MSVTISSPQLRAEVSADGAELIRLQDEQGRDWLWDGDPAFWTGRSPLLFPIVGRVRNDRIHINGLEYELPKHGFARTSRFEVEEANASQCRLRLCSSEATLQRYPFPFQLDVTYAVEGATLSITAARDEYRLLRHACFIRLPPGLSVAAALWCPREDA